MEHRNHMVEAKHIELAKAFMKPSRARTKKAPMSELGMKGLPDEMQVRHDFMHSDRGKSILKRVITRSREVL